LLPSCGKRLKEGLLLEAAHLYKICIDVPEGERYDQLAAPFRKYDQNSLLSLASLPFETVITTNYDRSLHDAFGRMRHEAPKSVELKDPTLKECLYWKDFYIARIHGRAEVPRSIILDTEDYRQLYEDTEYSDFLHHVFTQKRCVFVGFSFVDPAIDRILQFIRDKGVQPKKHLAFVPDDAGPLKKRMSEYNIQVVPYKSDDNHRILWDGIEESGLQPTTVSGHDTLLPSMFDLAKRLLAVCYARVLMGAEATALKEIVIEGILLSEMSGGITKTSELSTRLKSYLSLSDAEAQALVINGLSGLGTKKKCLRDGDEVVLLESFEPSIQNSPVAPLVDGLVGRLALREKYEVKPELRDALTKIVEEVIVLRGFDLGAEFSGATIGEDIDPLPTIVNAIERHLPTFWQNRKQQIAEVFVELLRMPDAKEERILAHLGRISFGVELVLQAGRTTMYKLSLPQTVYLDASVVLPAIVTGHPLQASYVDALRKLQEASRKAGGTTAILFADVFLDEVIGHRRKAIDLVAGNALEEATILERRILYFGADKVNVFIGGYSTWIKSKRSDKSFAAFLAEVAPYNNHKELQDFLSSKGISIISTAPKDQADVIFANDILNQLLDAYETEEKGFSTADQKPTILKKHEAYQLSIMYKNIAAGQRVMLVTADNRLRRMVGKSDPMLRDALVSPRNLLQLVDLLVGVDVDPSSVATLLWSVQAADERAIVKDYLIARALPHYNAALLLKMGDLLDDYVDRILHEAKLEKINLRAVSVPQRQVTSKFMDRVEDEVFASLAQEVRKLEEKIKMLEKGSQYR
jgi:hypothetical protein